MVMMRNRRAFVTNHGAAPDPPLGRAARTGFPADAAALRRGVAAARAGVRSSVERAGFAAIRRT